MSVSISSARPASPFVKSAVQLTRQLYGGVALGGKPVGVNENGMFRLQVAKGIVNEARSQKIDFKTECGLDSFRTLLLSSAETFSEGPRALNGMGNVHADKQELDEAGECYKKALALDPNNSTAWNNLGSVHFDKNELDKAVKCYKKAFALDPKSSGAWNNLGDSYSERNELDEAGECYKKALELDPKSSAGWYNLGTVHYHRNEFERKWLKANSFY